MHLPEIAYELTSKGFIVEIANHHQSIAVSLKNRRVRISEIEHALNWDINHAVRFHTTERCVVITE